jgi:hypothetical protein
MTRIGTWNLAGRWGTNHERLLERLDCDVLLLTEVRRDVELAGYHRHLTECDMAEGRAWAGVFGRASLTPVPDPHPATARATCEGVTFAASILPWKGARSGPPWVDGNHGEKTRVSVEAIRPHLTPISVWGGDFNHALAGQEWAGSHAGRGHIRELVDGLGLQVPTALLEHKINGLLSIDHIAVPGDVVVKAAARHDAGNLSDHSACVVDLA